MKRGGVWDRTGQGKNNNTVSVGWICIGCTGLGRNNTGIGLDNQKKTTTTVG